MFRSLAEYPSWFVAACVTLTAALGLWVVVKVLKAVVWVALLTVLCAGAFVVLRLLFK